MDFSIHSIPLAKIETEDQTFKITTNPDVTDLALSISAIGLLQPPLFVRNGQRYTIVSGFRRIAACQAANMDNIQARIGPDGSPWIDYARCAIAENAFQRPLNVVEQSRAFALIRRFADNSADWSGIAASAGLPHSQTAMDRILPIVDMPESMQRAIVDNLIALPIALHINQLKAEDVLSLSDFFIQINAGLNVQRELLALICEISKRDEISITHLLDQNDISAILENRDSPSPHKVRQLRQLLRILRYPELSKAEAAYNQTIKSLKLNPCVQLQPPRFFEGTCYQLTLTLNSRRQLRSLLPDVEKIANHPHILPEH